MRIHFVDEEKKMTDAWKEAFSSIEDVPGVRYGVVRSDFGGFMDEHPEIDAVVCPADSFGFMTGRFGLSVKDYFGGKLENSLRNQIANYSCGMISVGSSESVFVGYSEYYPNGRYLIAAPVSMIPEKILDPRIIYWCVRSSLISCVKLGLGDVVIPALGSGQGMVDPEIIAEFTALACGQVFARCAETPKYEAPDAFAERDMVDAVFEKFLSGKRRTGFL